MYCNQCEQTSKGIACTSVGVCGKKEEVALLQDLLTYVLKGLSEVALAAREKGIETGKADALILEGMFATLTNVNFDPERIADDKIYSFPGLNRRQFPFFLPFST
ncbi:Prismane/CO dehydrogenase family protein [Thermosyntropha lipolytica DSM 11003]|uniref:Prismane/CO dehydrogenase family protein n=1 Tax=Thermosyntropha lipolytica DSM 11003 TaxID=1123382 RepID=A0A1M5RIQ5_9FIRM|nr:hypothetical protein [Thermosyntropha lipolytica]SHH25978.1 Prismane/CO dehydrogenase family protein [Thermosyntropha lipolytica DSM 11003]